MIINFNHIHTREKEAMAVNLGKADEFILWTVEDLAELLDIQKDTVRKMLGSGELPAKKIARRWYVSNQALINWFNTPSPEDEEE